MSEVIVIQELNKVYEGIRKGQDVHALKDLNLTVGDSEIFSYLGPNGSGKTTTIKMLLGLIFPTSGSMEILGTRNLGAHFIRRQIGYLPEGAYYPDFLCGEEVLNYYGKLYGLGGRQLKTRISEVLEIVGMAHARKRLIRGYSKGMRQRIGLAQALISDPQILILDEPTTGLDPIARKDIRDILARLRNEGKTLFISSHELLEVEMISDRVGILYDGKLETCGTVDDLLTDRDLTVTVEGVTESIVKVMRPAGVELEDHVDTRAVLRVPDSAALYTALDLCKEHKLTVHAVAPRRETLEELFVRVVGDAQKLKEATGVTA